MKKCDGCTLCCELFEVKDLNKPAYEMCKHCDGNGCSIHPTRPQVCRDFHCAYLQFDGASLSIRPDKCGVIFEKITDRIFHGTIRYDTELTNTAKGQIKSFLQQDFSVFIRNGEKCTIFVSDNHDREEILKEYEEQVEVLHDN